MARTSNIGVFRGEDLNLTITVYASDSSSTPLNVGGMTFVFTVSRAPNSTDKLISKTGAIITAASGTVRVILEAADTTGANIEPGAYFWDFCSTDSGNHRVMAKGRFLVQPGARIPTV